MKYLDFIKQEMAVIMDRDPAIKSKMEVFLYPSFWALLKYRKAHKLYKKGHFYRARKLSWAPDLSDCQIFYSDRDSSRCAAGAWHSH